MTTAATRIYENQTFYAPRYEIALDGQDLITSVGRDIKEILYTDSMQELDTFEFVLHDWDPVAHTTKYSSPYDESGSLRTLPDGSSVPLFDPGAQVTLRLGYYGGEDPVAMFDGKIVSITPAFPVTGTPTLRIRAVNQLYILQRRQETMNFENKTDSQIAQEIADALEIPIDIPSGQIQQENRHEFISFANQYPIDFLYSRARRLGYDLHMTMTGSGPRLFFGRPSGNETVYEIEWGRSLVSFAPNVRTRDQVTRVVVRGWRPGGRGDKRRITGTATFQDLNLVLPDSHLLDAIDQAIEKHEEQVVDDPIRNQAEADAKARGLLETRLLDLVTGDGVSIGTPRIRAARPLEIKGLGFRYSGRYRVTESSHKIDQNGYLTNFKARLEVIQ
jgi:phage protein D